MDLKIVEARVAHRRELLVARLDGHRDFLPIRQARRHRLELRERDVTRRFRMQDETEAVRAATVGELRVDERREATDLEANAVDHRENEFSAAITWSTCASVNSGKIGRLT